MSADLLCRLIEAGTPAALVAEVAMLAGEVAALERRRASDRERQAARRHVMSRDSADVTDETPAPNKSPPDPQKLTPNPAPTGRVIPMRAREKFAPPEGVADDQWKGFLQLRSAKRQPMTDRGYALIAKKLTGLAEHGFPPGEMIDLAIERGWTTVHEPHDYPGQQNGQSKPSSRQGNGLRGSRPSPALDMWRAAAAEEAAECEDEEANRAARNALPAIGSSGP